MFHTPDESGRTQTHSCFYIWLAHGFPSWRFIEKKNMENKYTGENMVENLHERNVNFTKIWCGTESNIELNIKTSCRKIEMVFYSIKGRTYKKYIKCLNFCLIWSIWDFYKCEYFIIYLLYSAVWIIYIFRFSFMHLTEKHDQFLTEAGLFSVQRQLNVRNESGGIINPRAFVPFYFSTCFQVLKITTSPSFTRVT